MVKEWEVPSQVTNGLPVKAIKTSYKVTAGITSVALGLVRRQLAPLPPSPDGLAAEFSRAASDAGPSAGLAQVIFNQFKQGTLGRDTGTLVSAGLQILSKPMDDRKLLLEHIIQLLSGLEPATNNFGTFITNTLVTGLWHDLPKPPQGRVGDSKYRKPDGSCNNPFQPELGQANRPYARSVPPMHPMPTNLPDPALVFDTLMARPKNSFHPHPNKISSLLFNFATLIIHSIFNSKHGDENINESSSYLDLSFIYGNNAEEVAKIRVARGDANPSGFIKPDVVSNRRLFLMPTAIIALAVLFARHHNIIAERLLAINENGRFTPRPLPLPETEASKLSPEERRKRSIDIANDKIHDDLFETARLVNCGMFLQIVFCDYIAVILGQNFTESTWRLVPTGEVPATLPSGSELPRGTGNAVSFEFNILYRWHSTISQADSDWVENVVKGAITKLVQEGKLPPDTDAQALTPQDFQLIYECINDEYFKDKDGKDKDVTEWAPHDMPRQADGRFKDSDLVKFLTKATQEVAGEFGARRVPQVMRVIDILGIQAARTRWGAASLNEFRRFLGLTEYKSFKEWNPDETVHKAAEHLYTRIENLELYPGLLAEEIKKPMHPGSGLCPGFTISRAILSDATALVRGDRYFCQDYNSGNLTTWAFEEVTPDAQGGSHGGIIGRFFMRVLPDWYSFNSLYALFPFTTPEQTIEILQQQGKLDKYDTTPPKPENALRWKTYQQYEHVKEVVRNKQQYAGIFNQALFPHIHTPFLMKLMDAAVRGFDDAETRQAQRILMHEALFPEGWKDKTFNRAEGYARDLISKESWKVPETDTRCLDVLRDAFVPAAVELVCHQFGIPLKTEQTKRGAFTPEELYLLLVDAYSYVFLNYDPADGFSLREDAHRALLFLRYIVNRRMIGVANTPTAVRMFTRIAQDLIVGYDLDWWVANPEATAFYRRLLASHMPSETLLENALFTIVSAANIPHQAAQCADFYLRPENKNHLQALYQLCSKDTFDNDDRDVLFHYMLEALRLSPAITGIVRRAKQRTTGPDGAEIQAGDLINCDLTMAGLDAMVFPEPHLVRLDRPIGLYSISGRGVKSQDNTSFNHMVVAGLLKPFFALSSLERAQGPAGQLNPIANLRVPYHPLFMTPRGTSSASCFGSPCFYQQYIKVILSAMLIMIFGYNFRIFSASAQPN
ncbi:BQ2448_1270 [Microbotryum intermedium]|uniref:BQ2448_1270 protein n=1 Tax=Microbotryum intermedium TaxID=269621 RepID=A0A238FFR2_9BASI|nr:BQ2448_1270 [Microbotryum intermedium]